MKTDRASDKFWVLVILLMAAGIEGYSQNINTRNISCPGGVNVNSWNGNMNMHRNDIFIEGRKFDLDMTFYYSSLDCQKNYGYGKGWRFRYLMQYLPDSTGVTIITPDGRKDHFTGDSTTNVYTAPAGIFDSLSYYQAGKYVLVTKKKIKYFFDNALHKRLTRIEEPNGNAMTFTYSDSLITEVTDASGRSLQLSYNGGKLTTLTDAVGTPVRTVQYAYNANGNLTEVTDPAGNKTKYSYIVNGPMSTVTDKNANVVDIIYGSNFMVKEVITCITDQRISYNTLAHSTFLVEMVESGNQTTIFQYDDNGNIINKTGNCCGYNVSYEYDGNRNVSGITDANGNKTEFTYDSKGNLTSKKDPLGISVYYTYEPGFNKVASYIDKNGNTTTYTYDFNGNLVQVAYPLGITNSFIYASNGDLISKTDGNGNTRTYEYDLHGNRTELHKPLGVNSIRTFSNRSLKTSYVDPKGNPTTYTYNIRNRLTGLTDALGNSVAFGYDSNNNLTSITDKKGHTAVISYDALNRPVTITDPLNHAIQFSYNAKSKIIAATDANGNTMRYAYDNLNRLVSKTNGANETTTYSHDGRGNIISIATPNGNTVSISYDAMNRVTQASDNTGLLFTRNYDNKGNIISTTDANGNTNSFAYDALSRRISSADPLGNSSEFTYDNNFNLLSFTDRNNQASSFYYDALNRLINTTDALNNPTSFDYDAAGNLISATDANNHSTTYGYDALNRNTLQTFADATTNSYAYDANGNLVSRTDNNGALTSFIYDDNDRLVTKNFPGSNDDVFAYDAGGRMVSAVNSNAAVTFTYDAANRITAETLNGKTTSYAYDVAGNKRMILYPGGRTLVRTLDARKRLVEIKEGNNILTSFNYNAANRLVSKTNPSNGTATSYTYDANNRMVSMITGPGGLLNFEYGYDNEGNKLFERKLHNPDHSEQYAYDNRYQLSDFKSGTLSGPSIPSPLHHNQYNYDALGNRAVVTEDAASTTYTSNSMNAYTSIAGTATSNPQYDSNGNVLNDGTYTYSYDSQNLLISVNNGSVASYQYDALGRRVRKTVGSAVTDYVYAGVHEIENLDGAGNVNTSYVFGRGIDDVLSAKINGADYFYFKNALGSVSAVTNSSGSIAERYEYDPFGRIKIFDSNYNHISASTINNSVYYTGRTYDAEIDKYYYRARQYDANNGRFIQRDPLKYIDGLNMYAYVGNNALNKTDPSGTQDVAPVVAGVSVVVAGGAAPYGASAWAAAQAMVNSFAALAAAGGTTGVGAGTATATVAGAAEAAVGIGVVGGVGVGASIIAVGMAAAGASTLLGGRSSGINPYGGWNWFYRPYDSPFSEPDTWPPDNTPIELPNDPDQTQNDRPPLMPPGTDIDDPTDIEFELGQCRSDGFSAAPGDRSAEETDDERAEREAFERRDTEVGNTGLTEKEIFTKRVVREAENFADWQQRWFDDHKVWPVGHGAEWDE